MMLRGGGTKQERRSIGPGRGQLQATQGIVAGQRFFFGQPGEQRAEGRALETLLDGPETIGGPLGAHHQHLPHVYAPLRPAGGIGHMRRREQHDLAAASGQRGKRSGQKADLADAGFGKQQFDQATRRPAAARKLFVERPKAAWRGWLRRTRQRIAAPESACEAGFTQRGFGTSERRDSGRRGHKIAARRCWRRTGTRKKKGQGGHEKAQMREKDRERINVVGASGRHGVQRSF